MINYNFKTFGDLLVLYRHVYVTDWLWKTTSVDSQFHRGARQSMQYQQRLEGISEI
jgi:hypothetical protein